MRTIGLHCCMALMISPFWAGEANRVPLIAEQQTTLHVGQVAVLQTPWTRSKWQRIEYHQACTREQQNGTLSRNSHRE